MTESSKARLVGFNHVALEVGDIDEALAFYGRLFQFELRGRGKTMAFIDLGVRATKRHTAAESCWSLSCGYRLATVVGHRSDGGAR